jgi:hypothetical protein
MLPEIVNLAKQAGSGKAIRAAAIRRCAHLYVLATAA